jgi:F-type H+-transporting ATPase subunit alpha
VPYRIGKTIVIVYAGMNGYTDDVPVAKIQAYEEQLFSFLEAKYPKLFDEIEAKKKLDDDLTAQVKKALEEFGKTFA